MKIHPELVVCKQCNSVYKTIPGTKGDVVRCTVCDAMLYRGGRVDIDSWLALTFAAAIAFIIANLSPVIAIRLQDLHNDATWWDAVQALATGPTGPIAVPLALSILIVPCLQIALLCWILPFARTGRRAPGFTLAMRLLVSLRPWSMVEVAMVGILVGAIKLASYMKVIPGAGAWATAATMVLLILVVRRDVRVLWDLTEPPTAGQAPA